MSQHPDSDVPDRPAEHRRAGHQPAGRQLAGGPSGPAGDPGSSGSLRLVVVLTVVLAAAAILWQNAPDSWQDRALGITPKPPEPAVLQIQTFGAFDLTGRYYVKLSDVVGADPLVLSQLDATAATVAERIAVAIVAAELSGPEPALERLDAIEAELRAPSGGPEGGPAPGDQAPGEPVDDLLTDIERLRQIYAGGDAEAFAEPRAGPRADPPADPDRQRLVERYGYFGRLAATHGLPDTDPQREPLVTGGITLLVFLLLVAAVVIGALVTGFVLLILGIVRLGTGRLKLRPAVPARGGSVFLETYAIFVGGFLFMSVASRLAEANNIGVAGLASVVMQWLLLLVPLWPLVRGMPSRAYRHAIGLHGGTGVLREIGCGLLGYLAALPLFALGVLVLIVIVYLKQYFQGTDAQPPSNKIVELIGSGDPVVIVLIFALATIWAPITEELVFRGALYRHLRAYVPWGAAAVVSALLFAYMHSYGPLMVAPLIALGFMFAFMREWRGSIIAPMVAHFLHNATLMVIMITLFSVLG